MAAGTGGTSVLDTTGEYIFQPAATSPRSDGCTSFSVCADADNDGNVKVLVTGLHDSGAEDVLGPGEGAIYRFNEMGIREVWAEAATGTQTIRWGVRARTGASA